MSNSNYDLIIEGAGVTGGAEAFIQARYSNFKRILIVERRTAPGMVNSSKVNNSQTPHWGPIETNYDLAAAMKVSGGAVLLRGYLENHAPSNNYIRIPKMVIGVGDKEVASIRERYATFKPHYPDIRLLERDELAVMEPAVMNGRDPNIPIVSLFEGEGYAVDYQRVAESFVTNAMDGNAQVDCIFHEQVKGNKKVAGGYEVIIGNEKFFTRFLIVAAGSPSLVFAHQLGLGLDYGMLPVAGSFYRTWSPNGALNGKVYTVQNPKIPFAAPHGDPAVYNRREIRFGPTAKPMPLLERGNYATFMEFMRTGTATPRGMVAALKIASDWDISRFLLKNQAYELPYFGKRIFLKDVRKICPALTAGDIELDKGAGGIRGQLIDLKKGTMARGKDKLVGDGVICIMAPSPGASFCLGNAVEDAKTIRSYLGDSYRFDEAGMRRDFGLGPDARTETLFHTVS